MSSLLLDAASAMAIRTERIADWDCCARAPGSVTHPDQLGELNKEWLSARAPGTAAAALEAAGKWDFRQPADLDASDWWYRARFRWTVCAESTLAQLCFDGLATNAEVWLNGVLLLTTDNMFRSYRVDVAAKLREENELAIRFRSLTEELQQKRSRPKWKTNLVRNQQLRWHRTSLLGRIPGWAPCAPAIGPWRAVRLESGPVLLEKVHLSPSLEGERGVVEIDAQIAADCEPLAATLRVGEVESTLRWEPVESGWRVCGKIGIESPPKWMPHTHGEPTLLGCELSIATAEGSISFPLSSIGFRKLEVESLDSFSVAINGEPIYCRGACWTVSDLLSPDGDEATLRRDLQLAKAAGANLLRVGGTMQYESETFYRLCDELGILVWQDFMFANLDYPVDDVGFRANIRAEAVEQLQRLAAHPCVVIYCGNSEIEQQTAMLGMPRERWSNEWFSSELPQLCAAHHPSTFYLPSTPTGGVLPFHTHTGVAHYYGVGAYLRSEADVRQADVKFSSECLGFANLPEPATMFAVTGGSHPVMHDPTWKQRVPRDGGAGWDFEDVRDHYLRQIYSVEPQQLRSFDMPRYLELSRTAGGEMMARVFSEWRSTHSHNRGGLVWFFKDLWPGAGWGIVDSLGLPKAAYYYLRRSWQTRQLTITDEGLNGIDLHLSNETSETCHGTLELVLLKEPNVVVARQEVPFSIAAHSQSRRSADEILGRFTDLAYAYRFGPPPHDVVAATWIDEKGAVISEAFHFVQRKIAASSNGQGIVTSAVPLEEGGYQVAIESDRFLHAVRLEAEGYLPEDNYFHLAPHRTRLVRFTSIEMQNKRFCPTLQALNLEADVSIQVAANSLRSGR